MMEDLKEFKEFLTLCREHGVVEVFFKGVNVKFGPQALPEEKPVPQTVDEKIACEISDAELLYYSSNVQPDEVEE